jgi:hypothetical protein
MSNFWLNVLVRAAGTLAIWGALEFHKRGYLLMAAVSFSFGMGLLLTANNND